VSGGAAAILFLLGIQVFLFRRICKCIDEFIQKHKKAGGNGELSQHYGETARARLQMRKILWYDFPNSLSARGKAARPAVRRKSGTLRLPARAGEDERAYGARKAAAAREPKAQGGGVADLSGKGQSQRSFRLCGGASFRLSIPVSVRSFFVS